MPDRPDPSSLPDPRPELTRLLRQVSEGGASEGGEGASTRLFEVVYAELRQMAAARMAGERREHTLQPTALVHEAYVRLTGDGAGGPDAAADAAPGGSASVTADGTAGGTGAGTGNGPWDSRAHFFGAAARAMQRILVEHARARGRAKRGGGARRLPLSVAELAEESDLETVLAVQQAVERLAVRDPRLAEIVRLRFYAGLSEADVASALDLSERTVRRDWALARAWLLRELES